jgi:hypothetical protein
MIELGITPINTRLSPCSVAPREFITNNDGTISGLAVALGVPIVFIEGDAGAPWPKAPTVPASANATLKSPASEARFARFIFFFSHS